MPEIAQRIVLVARGLAVLHLGRPFPGNVVGERRRAILKDSILPIVAGYATAVLALILQAIAVAVVLVAGSGNTISLHAN